MLSFSKMSLAAVVCVVLSSNVNARGDVIVDASYLNLATTLKNGTTSSSIVDPEASTVSELKNHQRGVSISLESFDIDKKMSDTFYVDNSRLKIDLSDNYRSVGTVSYVNLVQTHYINVNSGGGFKYVDIFDQSVLEPFYSLETYIQLTSGLFVFWHGEIGFGIGGDIANAHEIEGGVLFDVYGLGVKVSTGKKHFNADKDVDVKYVGFGFYTVF